MVLIVIFLSDAEYSLYAVIHLVYTAEVLG